MQKRLITGVLLLFIVLRFGWLVYHNSPKYVPDYWMRYPVLKSVYGESQYMMKNWKYWIPDETVYSYAAGAYVQGASPILVEPTQPPLGKYIVGLSILLTGNENYATLFFFTLLLTGIYVLVKQMTHSTVVSLLTVLASLFERLFTDQLSVTPLLDIIIMPLILYAIVGVSYAMKTKKPQFILLAYLCLAVSTMTKAWLITAAFAAPITLYILVKQWRYYPYIIVGGAIEFLVLCATYWKLFVDHYSVIEIVKVQKWIYWYYSGRVDRLFTVWPLIFLNKWYVWWGESPVSKDPNWSISWPITTVGAIIASVSVFFKRFTKIEPVLSVSVICFISYSIFISFGQASARYLLLMLPISYALTAWILYTIVKKILPKKIKL